MSIQSRSGRNWRWLLAAALAVLLALAAADQVLALPYFKFGHNSVARRLFRQPLEARFARAEVGDGSTVTGVISLGGGEERVRETGRLARRWPHARVVMSDWPLSLPLLGDGIDAARITLEERSRTTWENALFVRDLVRPKAGERWLLVTSAMHMPRAIGAFRKAGFEVEAWPVYDVPENFLVWNMVRHEWLGLVGYRISGRSDALWPGPALPDGRKVAGR